MDATLDLVADRDLPSIGALLGDQAWFDAAGAAIFLMANCDRTMWNHAIERLCGLDPVPQAACTR